MPAGRILVIMMLSGAAFGAGSFDVSAYGATGDGVAKDTEAIQRAIDACGAAGGGEVVLPKGRYLSGSLVLRNGVHLVVTPEAVLLGSTALEDYPTRRLLSATDAADVGVGGGGTIDGQGEAFWERRNEPYTGPSWRGTAQFAYRALKRPAFLHFLRCRGVTVRDIRLVNSPSWTLHLQRCTTVLAERINIRNPLYGPNTDGIDINSCIDVKVSDCDIVTGDDGVVLKSTEPGHDHPSRNIEVTGCRIWSACNALKLGTETHDSFENIVFRNCHLYSATAVPQERALAGVAIESVDGAQLKGITIMDITMDNLRAPLFIRLGHRGGNSPATRQVEPRVPGRIQGVTIRNLKAERALFESSITGIPGYPVEDVSLENVSLSYEGGGRAEWITDTVADEALIDRYPEAQMFGRLPAYGLYCRHVQGLRLTEVSVRCQTADARPMLVCDDVADLILTRTNAAAAPASAPLLWFLGVRNATVRDCLAPPGTSVFLAVEGSPETLATVRLDGNDTRQARTALQTLPPGGLLSADLPVFRETGPAAGWNVATGYPGTGWGRETAPGLIVIEAEALRLTSPLVVQEDPGARHGRCVAAAADGQRDAGTGRCRFELVNAGRYVVWVRAFGPSGEADSFTFDIDRGQPCLSDLRQRGIWFWDPVRRRGEGGPDFAARAGFALAAGAHTLTLRNRESGTRIDTLVIVPEAAAFDPLRDLPAAP